jgi:hypothetical protein
VRLHFAELVHTAANQRVFDVRINDAEVEANLDVFATAGGAYKALVKTYAVTSDASGVIRVELSNGGIGVAMVSGIEVFSP